MVAPQLTEISQSASGEKAIQADNPHGKRDWWCAFGSSLAVFFAFPPADLWWLAWLAPLGWLQLIAQPSWNCRRPYWMTYFAGLLHWLLLVHWIRLPHWSAYFGWFALAGYLACYLPVFIGVTRHLVHRWHWPLVVAAPVVWTGLEYARGYLLTGFSMSLLGHTQIPLLRLVQIADVVGAYGVSFVVMMFGAGIHGVVFRRQKMRRSLAGMAVAIVILVLCVVYGHVRINVLKRDSSQSRALRVALIQGAFDTQFDGDLERIQRGYFDYVELSRRAAMDHDALDLMIWPESMFTGSEPMVTYDDSMTLAAVPEWNSTLDQLKRRLDEYRDGVQRRLGQVAQQNDVPMLVGMEWDHYAGDRSLRYNSAVFLDKAGRVRGRYDKTHPVMFGEYVPFGNWFPWLYRLTPMSSGLQPGDGPRTFHVGSESVTTTICFENTIPHLVRGHVGQLAERDEMPSFLVTISNDGWFWGSSLLDVHLACGIFRAIELRRPMLIAANTGFSAAIEATGTVQAKGPRRAEAILVAEVEPCRERSFYLRFGDWFAATCLVAVVLGIGGGVRAWRQAAC